MRDGNGRRILITGEDYGRYAPERVEEHVKLALTIEKVYSPDVAEIAFGEFAYEFSFCEIRHNGYRCVIRRVKSEGY